MATITITFQVPTSQQATKILDAYVRQFGWTPAHELTKMEFFKRTVSGHILGAARENLTKQAGIDASATMATTIDTENAAVTTTATQT